MDIEAIVESIWSAARRGIYYPPEWKGQLSTRDAYRVQLGMLAHHVARGEAHAGWKVGLTAKAMQVQQGVHEPVLGFLLESGHRPSGAVFRFAELIQPGFENELCLTIGTALPGPGVTLEHARAAIVAVAPAFEIIERRGDFAADLNLSLADNSQQKAFVTGPAMPVPAGRRLTDTSVEVFVNGQRLERAVGSEATGDPVGAVAWLANKLAELGTRIEAGARIMSGSLTKQYLLSQGDRIEARFEPYGAVRAEFR